LRAPVSNAGTHADHDNNPTATIAIATHIPTAVSMLRRRNGAKNATRAPMITRVSSSERIAAMPRLSHRSSSRLTGDAPGIDACTPV
jgi:hypothetical protein